MEHTTKGSSAARMAIMYITAGILIIVWTGIWWVYMKNHDPVHQGWWYVCWGLMLTGVALTVIGFIMGQVGRSAQQADLPANLAPPPSPIGMAPPPGPQAMTPPAQGTMPQGQVVMMMPQQAVPQQQQPMPPQAPAVPARPNNPY